jgi:hypothetical protein
MRSLSKLLVLIALSAAVLSLGESAAFAQRYYGRGYGPAPGYYAAPGYGWYGAHQHDGFYMRLDAGVGGLSASENVGGSTYTYSGLSTHLGAAFGGVVAPNLVIYGEFIFATVSNASLSEGGVTQSYSGTNLDVFGFGPGIAYYFEPINLYLSGTLTFTQVSFSDTYYGYSQGDTNFGLGVSLMLGKEWWVSRDWGIGIAGQFHLASMGDSVAGYNTDLRVASFAALFSATYN